MARRATSRKEPRRKPRIVPAANDPRSTIRLVEGEIERIVDEVESALIAANRGLYQRDGRIVCAVGVPSSQPEVSRSPNSASLSAATMHFAKIWRVRPIS